MIMWKCIQSTVGAKRRRQKMVDKIMRQLCLQTVAADMPGTSGMLRNNF